jgi:hypothetical protein
MHYVLESLPGSISLLHDTCKGQNHTLQLQVLIGIATFEGRGMLFYINNGQYNRGKFSPMENWITYKLVFQEVI